MTPDGKRPTKHKRYYDIFTWLVTQLAFTFTTAPFILLSAHDSMLAWARVYFYGVIGVTACSVFLLTPGKQYLQRKVKARATHRPDIARVDSSEGMHGATLGIPHEPGQEFDELVVEIADEVRRRKGSKDVPDSAELKRMVAEALDRNSGGQDKKAQ